MKPLSSTYGLDSEFMEAGLFFMLLRSLIDDIITIFKGLTKIPFWRFPGQVARRYVDRNNI